MGGSDITDTLEVAGEAPGIEPDDGPGMVVIFSGTAATCRAIPLGSDPVFLGRAGDEDTIILDDAGISRRHVHIENTFSGIRITDLESRNGTFVDGQRLTGKTHYPLPPRVMRLGRTVLHFVPNIRPFLHEEARKVGDVHIGPRMVRIHDRIAQAAADGDSMLFIGPSGTGKEVCAQAFHSASERKGPLIAVNCATIPSGLAERLLFGTKRGAYSGASADAPGYIEAAEGGTLFLDEVAELDEGVQAKLLRALEAREIFPLGATRPRSIDILLCAATLKDLRAEVNEGRFREDLYYRIARPEVRLLPLHKRIEEIPFIIETELQALGKGLVPAATFIEACALLPWPGNIRELKFEVREAGRAALADSRKLVEPRDLSDTAGKGVDSVPSEEPSGSSPQVRATSRAQVEEALRREQGNVSATARALGWHRNQLRRWLSRHGVDPALYKEEETISDT